uniref:Uncharacterized protein n=1 Tax=Arundo donax TaxID=35708 RepID=A0A0A9GTB9_ARUDO
MSKQLLQFWYILFKQEIGTSTDHFKHWGAIKHTMRLYCYKLYRSFSTNVMSSRNGPPATKGTKNLISENKLLWSNIYLNQLNLQLDMPMNGTYKYVLGYI